MDAGALLSEAEGLRKLGPTVMFVAVDGAPAGLIVVADPIRSTTAEAIRSVREEGIRVVVLTGDNRTTAQAAEVRETA